MRLRTVAAAVAGAALLASCGSETTAPPAQPATSESPSTGHGALARCLSEHGVPVAPGPAAGPPPGVDQDTWQKAMNACSTFGPGPES